MSVVVAYRDERFNRIVMGADGQVTQGQHCSTLKQGSGKIWEYTIPKCPSVIMGCAGVWRDAQIIQNNDILDANDFADNPEGFSLKWMVNVFVPRMFALLDVFGRLGVNEEGGFTTKFMANVWLFACGDKCFRIDQDGCVIEMEDSFAIGSGSEIAEGSIEAYRGNNPFEAIETAINASAKNTIYVNDIIDFLTTDTIGDELDFVTEGDYEGLAKYWDEYEILMKKQLDGVKTTDLLLKELKEVKAKFDCFLEVVDKNVSSELLDTITKEYKDTIHALGLKTKAEQIEEEKNGIQD